MNDRCTSRRGIVLTPDDISDRWIHLIHDAGLNVFALHGEIDEIKRFVYSDSGDTFLSRLKKNGVDIEYEIHAMNHLLQRSDFEKHSDWFRMNEKGDRTPDGNFCPSTKDVMEIVCSNALSLAENLQPTTNRYYFWADDMKAWCRCKKCAPLSASDQNLIVMNAIIKKLRQKHPDAILAYLAYLNTLEPPKLVKPEQGIFLEFAPIQRRYDAPLADKNISENVRHVGKLDCLIEVFGNINAQVLEYWLDSSLFSKYTKPAKQIPFNRELIAYDIALYKKKGVESITTFGVYLNDEYFCKYGTEEVFEYGMTLKRVLMESE